MPKVMFTISYDVKPEKRDEYLELSRVMKDHVTAQNGKNYAIFEHKTKKNSFSEVYILGSMEEYEQLDDQDDTTSQLVQRLEDLLADGKMKYTTLVELE
jgi:L-rhamnose mutarotase